MMNSGKVKFLLHRNSLPTILTVLHTNITAVVHSALYTRCKHSSDLALIPRKIHRRMKNLSPAFINHFCFIQSEFLSCEALISK